MNRHVVWIHVTTLVVVAFVAALFAVLLELEYTAVNRIIVGAIVTASYRTIAKWRIGRELDKNNLPIQR